MEDLYVNKVKLGLAEAESVKTGGDVKEIYLRMGGLIIPGEPISQKEEKPVKAKKK